MDKVVEIVDNTQQSDSSPDFDRSPVLGVFAKEPIPGQVKTRLCPPLAAAEAAELYRSLQRETVIGMATAGFPVVLFYVGEAGYFTDEFPGVRLVPQGTGCLGERIERALRLLLAEGAPAAALIGTDSPDLPPDLVGEAFSALRDQNFVTIPARDGGYVLVGESRHEPRMFQDIPWSTGGVLGATRSRALELGITYREVGHWEDVDDWPSLQRLLLRSPQTMTAGLVRSRWLHLLR